MGAKQVFETLRDAGLTLFLLKGNTIRAAPPEAITPTARAMIREHKAGLLDLLRQGAVNDQATTQVAPASASTAPAATHQDHVGEWKTGTISDEPEDSTPTGHHHGTVDDGLPPDWSAGLAKLRSMRQPSDIPLQRWLAIVNAAALFADRWAVMAAKLGWTVHECFGVHQDCPARRFDAAGLLMALADPSKTLVELTQDLAIFEVGRMRARQTLHRDMIFSHEQRLLWELK